jgi:hypothetical protein
MSEIRLLRSSVYEAVELEVVCDQLKFCFSRETSGASKQASHTFDCLFFFVCLRDEEISRNAFENPIKMS